MRGFMIAIVIGATGLVGKSITKELLNRDEVKKVIVFSRRTTGLLSSKLTENIVEFESMIEWKDKIAGDVLYSALGTTKKIAKSKEAQFKVDFTYQYMAAQFAKANGVKHFVLISSVNSSSKSPFFYLKIKGQLEEKIQGLKFDATSVIRPGPLKGEREIKRNNEKWTNNFLELLPKFLITDSLRPVDAHRVARVALLAGLEDFKGFRIIKLAGS
jgi:uncharacterized protein YbjT (DUF2867 family)